MPKNKELPKGEDLRNELDNLEILISSPEWIEALKIIKKHKEDLQEKVNSYIRVQDWTNAFGTLCRRDDAEKLFILLKQRLETLRKE